MDIQAIREDFPALRRYVWFQNGGVSMTPSPVAEEHIRLMREILERGPMHIVYPEEEIPRRKRTMERLCGFFGLEPGGLGLMRGVSEAYQTVLRGLDWKSGDQILISEEEEGSVLMPTLHLRERFGLKIVKVPRVGSLTGQVEAFASRITDRTRLVAFSHVTTDAGHRMPVREISRVARDRGALTFVDTAHSAGLFPMSLREMGCDFAGILSYKWMYAPYAAGALYVRPERLKDLAVTYAGGRAEAWLDFKADRFALKDDTGRFQYGPWSWPLVHAWVYSLDYMSRIGLDLIWNRTVTLTTRLKTGLKRIPGVRLITPESPDLSAALVTFQVEGWEGFALQDAMRRRWNIVIKGFDNVYQGVRTSVPFFLLEEEIDLLLHAVGTLASEGPGQ